MRLDLRGKVFRCAALVAAALPMTACVPSAYVYDLPAVQYRGGGAPYPPAYPYGYPGYPHYYATPGYYSYSPYPPRVVYYDHDHRGDDCRHPSHRDGRRDEGRDRHDRSDRDRPPQDRGSRPDHRPPGQGPAADERCAGSNKCRPSIAPRPETEPRGMRELRVKKPAGADKTTESRKDVD